MKSRGFNVVAAERKRVHPARRVRRGHAAPTARTVSRPRQSPVIALSSRKFAVEPRAFIFSRLPAMPIFRLLPSLPLPPRLPISHSRFSPARRRVGGAKLCSASLTFRFSLFLLARRGIETKLLLTLSPIRMPFTTDAPRCWCETSRAQSRTHVRTSARSAHKDGIVEDRRSDVTGDESFRRGERTRGRKWVRRRKREREENDVSHRRVASCAAPPRARARARKPREDCETRAARLANLAGEWPAKIIRFFATRSH